MQRNDSRTGCDIQRKRRERLEKSARTDEGDEQIEHGVRKLFATGDATQSRLRGDKPEYGRYEHAPSRLRKYAKLCAEQL